MSRLFISPELLAMDRKYTSNGGEPFVIETNSKGATVSSGNVKANIVQTDVIAKNGVVHVRDLSNVTEFMEY